MTAELDPRPTRTDSIFSNLKTGGELVVHVAKHLDAVIAFPNKPFSASIDVTPNCNLRCQHCYLFGKGHQEEKFRDQEFLEEVKKFKQKFLQIAHCTWVGGEPMWRKEVLREAVKMFPLNWVVTNGTIPITGKWHNTAFGISIDGTHDIHNDIRQTWKAKDYDVYDRAKRTAQTATAPVYIHTVINQLNYGVIPALVEEWHRDTMVRGFQFSIHTPQKDKIRESGMTEQDERLYLGSEDRRSIVEMLLSLKKTYGDFIGLSTDQIKLYLPENQTEIYGKNCPLPKSTISLDSSFQKKEPCVMGAGMDCDKCGCAVPPMVASWRNRDVKSFLLNIKNMFK